MNLMNNVIDNGLMQCELSINIGGSQHHWSPVRGQVWMYIPPPKPEWNL